MAIARTSGFEDASVYFDYLAGGPTGVHAQVCMTRVSCTQNYWHRNQQVWSMPLKFNIDIKLRCCATRSTFCEECNGDSEDARRPFQNLQKPSNTFNNLQTPSKHTPVCVHLWGAQ
eukprot:15086385-Heterocapsa_arctica.AAC.1